MEHLIEFIIGTFIGYLIITVSESFFHRYIQHAPYGVRRQYRYLRHLGTSLRQAWYSHHVVHHYRTFRHTFTVQFDTVDQQTRLDHHLNEQKMIEIAETDYGVRIGRKAKYYIKYMAPTLPLFTLACVTGGAAFSLGALIPLIIWPMMAQFVHPYLHMRHDDIKTEAPLYARLVSKTTYFKWLAIHHWMHHRYEHCNYNLLLGGDVILGVQRFPRSSDWEEMGEAGLWTPAWSRSDKEVHRS